MDERELIDRLENLMPPDLDGARERAKLAARVRHSSAQRSGGWAPSPRPHRHPFGGFLRSTRGTVGIIACLVAIWLAAFTGSGDAVANWLGRQLGIGTPGGQPAPSRLRADLGGGTAAQGARAHVLVRGPAPAGATYAYLTYRSNRIHERCYELYLPEAPNTGGSSCGTELLPRAGLRVDFAGSSFETPGPLAEISGRTSADAAAVEVRFGERAVAAQLREVPLQALASAGVHRRFKVFVAFLSASTLNRTGRLRVVSLDGRGRELARKTIFLPDVEAAYDRRCEKLRRNGKERRALRACG
jgi:hypothetical protein